VYDILYPGDARVGEWLLGMRHVQVFLHQLLTREHRAAVLTLEVLLPLAVRAHQVRVDGLPFVRLERTSFMHAHVKPAVFFIHLAAIIGPEKTTTFSELVT